MFAAAARRSNFLEAVQSNRPDLVFLVRGKDISGQSAWYYVLVDRIKRDFFAAHHGAASVNLTDYGKILYSGFGDEPPADIKMIMENKYGFKE